MCVCRYCSRFPGMHNLVQVSTGLACTSFLFTILPFLRNKQHPSLVCLCLHLLSSSAAEHMFCCRLYAAFPKGLHLTHCSMLYHAQLPVDVVCSCVQLTLACIPVSNFAEKTLTDFIFLACRQACSLPDTRESKGTASA